METELKCNRLTCRQSLADKAVVTTCSHIFCVECTNELFTAARLCPGALCNLHLHACVRLKFELLACDTTLSEPDDIVVCSLHPSNDYKTVRYSAYMLRRCSWHQQKVGLIRIESFDNSGNLFSRYLLLAVPDFSREVDLAIQHLCMLSCFAHYSSFQLAVVRNLNDRNAQLQKQLENVIREANGEISLLSGKTTELERDLELERRKSRELQNASRDREKEYQKLKILHDKFKRKALLAPLPLGNGPNPALSGQMSQMSDDQQNRQRAFEAPPGNVSLGVVVGGMEYNGVQRTPVMNRMSGFVAQGQMHPQHNSATWDQQPYQQQAQSVQQDHARRKSNRQPFTAMADRSYRSTTDRSDSANEVESILVNDRNNRGPPHASGWVTTPLPSFHINQSGVQGFSTNTGLRRMGSKFRPAGISR